METPYSKVTIGSIAKQMRTAFMLLTLIVMSITTAQAQTSDVTEVKQILSERGEIEFSFIAQTPEQLYELSSFLSIDHERVSISELKANAFTNSAGFDRFLTYNLPFIANNIFMTGVDAIPVESRDVWDGDTSWDSYPTYSEYVSTMEDFATNYPSLCTLEIIGTSNAGRNLYVLKISDNPGTDEAEPEMFYTSSMHGDEAVGFPLMLRLIDYLLSNYGSDSEVTSLVNNTEIFINPSANPDGSYVNGVNVSGNLINPTRANGNSIDLNRNYPDPDDGYHADGNAFEPETLAFMAFQAQHNFILSANFHGGVEVMNYPWDTWNPGNSNTGGSTSISNPQFYHPYTDNYEIISQEWAALAQANGPSGYMNFDPDTNVDGNPGTGDGVTNGALWYLVAGGRQDYVTFFEFGNEITIELSDVKNISGSNLGTYWTANRQAFLNFIKQANYGIQGIITDSETGQPVEAHVYIASKHRFNSGVKSSALNGDYYRPISAGTYSITIEAPCYVSQTISGISVSDFSTTVQNVSLVPVSTRPTAADVTINTGETADLTATGTGTINWYTTVDGTTPDGTGPNYTTDVLTETTSFWVESVNGGASYNVDSPTVGTNGGYLGGTRYNEFHAIEDIHLASATIQAQGSGTITVSVIDNANVTVATKNIAVTAGSQSVDIGFDIPKGIQYRLEYTSTTSLWRNNSNVDYPYEYPGKAVIITSGAGDNFYYGFYDWVLADTSCPSNREEVVVTVDLGPCPGGITTYTTGGGWSNGVPDIDTQAIIADDYNMNSLPSINACTLTIENGATLTVAAGTYANVNGDITIDLGGTLDVAHEGSVVQVDNNSSAVNNGSISIAKTTESLLFREFTIASSPVTGETRNGAFNGAWRAYAHNTANFVTNPAVNALVGSAINFVDDNGNDRIALNPTDPLNPAQGYLVVPHGPSGSGTATLTYTQGTLNNGTIGKSLIYNGSAAESANLIGNPYASAISADEFLTANPHIPEIFLWNQNTNPAASGPGYLRYSMEDISYINASGGNAAASDPGNMPNDFISSGQGFGVKPINANSATFNNAMRETTGNDTYKYAATEDSFSVNRIWLQLNNSGYTDYTSTMLVAFLDGATDGIDTGYDTQRIGTYTSIFSTVGAAELGIQGKDAFDQDDRITVGVSTLFQETLAYTISIAKIEGSDLNDSQVYLLDNQTGLVTNLSERDYTFVADVGHYEDRFVMFFKNRTLGTDDVTFSDGLLMYPNPGIDIITIRNGSNQEILNLEVFDIQGRKVLTQSVNNSNTENTFNVSNLPRGVYMVKINGTSTQLVKQLIKN